MGASSSKASRAAGAAARQYPKRPPPMASQPTIPTTPSAPATSPPSPEVVEAARPPRPPPVGPTTHPKPQASSTRSTAINLDASDPDFARSLRSIGPVQPNPTLSPSSAFNPVSSRARPSMPDPRSNPAIMILDARARIQEEAEREAEEAGTKGFQGQRFLDVTTIGRILQLRDEMGKEGKEIEKLLGLKEGVVARLGQKGVVGLVREVGRAQREIDMV